MMNILSYEVSTERGQGQDRHPVLPASHQQEHQQPQTSQL